MLLSLPFSLLLTTTHSLVSRRSHFSTCCCYAQAEDADGGERGTFLGRGRTFLGDRSSFCLGGNPSFSSLGGANGHSYGHGNGTFLGDDSAAAGGASSGQLYSIMDDDDGGGGCGGGGGGGGDKPNFDGAHGDPARADANQGNRTEFITDSGL